jgi:hypothetical protein
MRHGLRNAARMQNRSMIAVDAMRSLSPVAVTS